MFLFFFTSDSFPTCLTSSPLVNKPPALPSFYSEEWILVTRLPVVSFHSVYRPTSRVAVWWFYIFGLFTACTVFLTTNARCLVLPFSPPNYLDEYTKNETLCTSTLVFTPPAIWYLRGILFTFSLWYKSSPQLKIYNFQAPAEDNPDGNTLGYWLWLDKAPPETRVAFCNWHHCVVEIAPIIGDNWEVLPMTYNLCAKSASLKFHTSIQYPRSLALCRPVSYDSGDALLK